MEIELHEISRYMEDKARELHSDGLDSVDYWCAYFNLPTEKLFHSAAKEAMPMFITGMGMGAPILEVIMGSYAKGILAGMIYARREEFE